MGTSGSRAPGHEEEPQPSVAQMNAVRTRAAAVRDAIAPNTPSSKRS